MSNLMDSTPSQNLITDDLSVPEPLFQKLFKLSLDGGRLIYRQSQGDTWEIVDIFVPIEKRHQSIGTQLVQEMICQVSGTIYLFTRESNTIARLFYSSLGFKETIIPGFYSGDTACIFTYRVQ